MSAGWGLLARLGTRFTENLPKQSASKDVLATRSGLQEHGGKLASARSIGRNDTQLTIEGRDRGRLAGVGSQALAGRVESDRQGKRLHLNCIVSCSSGRVAAGRRLAAQGWGIASCGIRRTGLSPPDECSTSLNCTFTGFLPANDRNASRCGVSMPAAASFQMLAWWSFAARQRSP